MSLLRTISQRLPSGSAMRRLLRLLKAPVEIARALFWVVKGAIGPAPAVIKRRIIRGCLLESGYRVAVETGTYRGDTTALLARHASRVVTIEVHEELYRQAVQRFRDQPNVEVRRADSASALPNLLEELSEPAFFWLDAHWSGGITGGDRESTPVEREIEAILASPHAHAIAIDDIREFERSPAYPRLVDVLVLVEERRPGSAVTTLSDIVYILLS